jgi:hypothetical protein
MMRWGRRGKEKPVITEQEYQEAQARVREYEVQCRTTLGQQRLALAKERQRVLLAAVEDLSVDGVDINGDYYFRAPHKIVCVGGASNDTWPDMNAWGDFVAHIKELFPYGEEWLAGHDYLPVAAAEKTQLIHN